MNNLNLSKILRLIYTLGDLFLLNLSFIVAYFIRFQNLQLLVHYLILLAYFNLLWFFISFLTDNYNISRTDGYTRVTKLMMRSIILHLFSVTAIFVFVKTTYFSRLHLGYHYVIFTFLLVFWRRGVITTLRYFRAKGINQKNFLIIGQSNLSQKLVHYFRSYPEYGYQFLGFFSNNKFSKNSLGSFQELTTYLQYNKVHEIYCVTEQITLSDVRKLRQLADEHLIRLKMLPDLKLIENENPQLELYGEIPVLLSRKEPLNNQLNQYLKRLFDVIFSFLVSILILAWLIPLISLLIKLDSKGPAFFIQKRSGKDGQDFACFKFRTMIHQKKQVFKQATKNDSRVTKIGHFLRKTNLDELPQFFNVLLGDMTVVGPRPHPIPLDDQFNETIEKYRVRNLVKPGVTGLAQVKGLRGETKDYWSMAHRVKMDIFYIENWSFFLDVKIILLTVWTMVRGDKNAF